MSRKTGYKIWHRWLNHGVDGLLDQSRRPHASPTRTPRETERLIVELRTKHPRWGSKKIHSVLLKRFPDLELPARSTVSAILKREGLITPRRQNRKHTHPGRPHFVVTAPNDLWTGDFKGQFRTRNGIYCYPLTVADQHSRFLLACEGLPSTCGAGVRPVFEELFHEHGLPLGILTDNGVPFATRGIHGLSVLNVWWMQLGIRHLRIEPGKPQQNGRHERMHRTLKAETTRPPALNLQRQQNQFDEFREEFNEIRPHEALDQETPASVWKPSKRQMPEKIKPPEYPGHFFPRLVCNAGTFRFKCNQIFLSHTLQQQYIALEE
ncbi:MAG: transposase, partial [bacterium]|nr:transposase [bacterium]